MLSVCALRLCLAVQACRTHTPGALTRPLLSCSRSRAYSPCHRFHEVFTSVDPEGSGTTPASSYVSGCKQLFGARVCTACTNMHGWVGVCARTHIPHATVLIMTDGVVPRCWRWFSQVQALEESNLGMMLGMYSSPSAKRLMHQASNNRALATAESAHGD